MKVHIFGASGSGVTTLGKALAAKVGSPYFDSDDYFWEVSDPPYTLRRDELIRNRLLLQDVAGLPNWILGGSIIHWDESLNNMFDLVIFLLIPPEIRLERLKKREFERYGDVIYTDPRRKKQYEDFLIWAGGYDDNTTRSQWGKSSGRTLQAHRNWITQITGKFVEIEGDTSLPERLNIILPLMGVTEGN